MKAFAPTVSPIAWTPCYRLVPGRYPPIDLFERVADPADWEAVMLVESLTNSRLRDSVGAISLVRPEHRATGPGASYIMAPFTHLSEDGGRFSTRYFGAYYAGFELETALQETIHHREGFLRATREPAMDIDMREVQARLRARLHDIRGMRDSQPRIYHDSDYSAPQGLASRLRAAGSEGIVYDSVRHAGGQCAAVFVPRLLSDARQAAHYCYVWDGNRISNVYRKTGLRTV